MSKVYDDKGNFLMEIDSKQQPPAGEWTKKIRDYIADFIYAEQHGVAMQHKPRCLEKDLIEACDHIDRKDKIIWAYESVHAPVNPLLAINKELLKALEEASIDFYYIHQHPEDAHTDSYSFMEKANAAIAKG